MAVRQRRCTGAGGNTPGPWLGDGEGLGARARDGQGLRPGRRFGAGGSQGYLWLHQCGTT